MLTILTGLCSSASYAVSDMLAQGVSRKVGIVPVLLWIIGVGVILVVPAALIINGLPSGAAEWCAAGLAALAGVVYVVGYGTLLLGLRRGDLSMVTALSSLQGAFIAIFAVAGGEPVTWMVALGLGLAVIGGTLAAVQGRARTTSGAGWALLAGLLFAVFVIIYDSAGALPWLTQTAFTRVASFAVILPYALLKSQTSLQAALRPRVAIAGALEVGGLVFLAVSVSLGPLAVAGVMTSQFATFAVLLGLIVLKERPRAHQLVGVGLTLAAVTLLSAVA
jgi:drug/metabolite transporter (DMT)-like permease